MKSSPEHATMDFETRSACDLRKHGSWLYSKHITTQAMCLNYKLPGQDHVSRWHMAHPQHGLDETPLPEDLFAFIEAGGLVEAHNSFFERVIWLNIMVTRHGWPKIKHLQWRCSAAKASAASLPRALGDAVKAMGLPIEKNMGGRRLMLKMSKPRQPRKVEIEEWMEKQGLEGDYRRQKKKMMKEVILWHEDLEDIHNLHQYCDQDVLSEEGLSNSLPELSDYELAVWQMDQHMNERGLKFDLDLAEAALEMATAWKKRLNDELLGLTNINSATRRAIVKAWLLENEDLELPDTTADTLEWVIEHEPLSDRARRICEIVMDVNKTSTRKYQAMLDKCDPDDWRARDLLMYQGAGPGRWSGKGIQVHNFPARNLIITDFEGAAEDIKSRNMDWCFALYDDVMKLLSHTLRGAIITSEDKDFMVADYSAIEARCVLWEAGANTALDVFRTGGNIYCDMATGIYGYKVGKKTHKSEYQFGKQAILGLGYGMGYLTFLLTCRKYKIYFTRDEVLHIMGQEKLIKYEAWIHDTLCLDGPPTDTDPEVMKKYANKRRQAAKNIRRLVDAREKPKEIVHELALMKYTVDVYRSRYPEVKQLWKDQEQAAIKAVRQWKKLFNAAVKEARLDWMLSGDEISYSLMSWETSAFKDAIEGPSVESGKTRWQVLGGFLCCFLPSGRPIRYRDPEIKMIKTTWGEDKPALRYMSVNGTTRKWERTYTYGGKTVENITQGIARDILAEAMLRVYARYEYDPAFTVHDELASEINTGEGSIEEYIELLCTVSSWAEGCPIDAEGERLTRYKK